MSNADIKPSPLPLLSDPPADALDRFFNVALDLLCIADTSGRFRRLNPRWEEILGYPLSELEGRSFLDFVHPEDLAATQAAVAQLAGQNRIIDFVNRYRCKDGSYRWIEWRSHPAGDLIYAAARDITQRKQVEAALQESEHRFRALLENAPAIIFMLDPNGVFLVSEGRALASLGLKPGQVVGQSALEIYRDVPSVLEGIKLALAGKTNRTVNIVGDAVFDTVYSAYLNPDGQPAGVVGVAVDITERQRAEAALLAGEKRFRTLFETMTEGVALHEIIYDSDGTPVDYRILDVNPAYEKHTGLTPSQVCGQLASKVYGTGSPPFLQEWAEVARTGIPHILEFQFEALHRDFQVSAVSPAPNTFATVFEDITERKRHEAALRSSLEEKEALLKEVHHRVKNNLQIVTSLLNLQAIRENQPSAKSGLRDMQNRIGAMALLHETLYRSGTFAKIDFGIYVQHLCDQLARSYQHANQPVKLQVQIANLRLGLEQAVPCGLVISELVTNAFKHAFPYTPAPEIRVRGHSPAPAEIEISITDNGIGLPAGFEPARAQSLGLQLANRLAGQLHGTLRIHSGPGTSISLRFPAESEAASLAKAS